MLNNLSYIELLNRVGELGSGEIEVLRELTRDSYIVRHIKIDKKGEVKLVFWEFSEADWAELSIDELIWTIKYLRNKNEGMYV